MVSIIIRVTKVKCKECEKYGQFKVPFAAPGRKYTLAFAREAVRMFLGSTVKFAAYSKLLLKSSLSKASLSGF
jgi:hypothetical protein